MSAIQEAPAPSLNGRPVSALCTEVRTAIDGDPRLTQRQVADEAGMSPAALSLYLGGKYSGDVDAVETKLRGWLDARGDRQEMKALVPNAPAYTETKTAVEVQDALRYAQALEDMVAVMGVPGIGKSTACAEYQRTRPNVWYASLAAHTTGIVPVLRAVSEAVGTAPGSGASGLARGIAAKVAKRRGLLIVDEAHHAQPPTLDAIRALHDATGVGVALVGGPELAARLDRLPQLNSRLGLRVIRKRAVRADAEALLDAWQIKGAAERKVLHAVAQRAGALRSVTKTLRLACALATDAGQPLGEEHIRQAATTLSTRITGDDDA